MTGENAAQPSKIFQSIAQERQYYGFLAAQRLPAYRPSLMRNQITPESSAATKQIEAREDISRAVELFAVGDELNGRREWYQAKRTMKPSELQQLAYVSVKNGPLVFGNSNSQLGRGI